MDPRKESRKPDGERPEYGLADMSLPDMSLSERSEPAEALTPSNAWSPIARGQPSSGWSVGQRVLTPWEPMLLYVGSIVKIEDSEAQIDFDDGDIGWVGIDQLRPVAFAAKQRVMCRRTRQNMYVPGVVQEAETDEVCVNFDDGTCEWMELATIRVPCQPTGPGAAKTSLAEYQATVRNLREGDRVWAPWQQGVLFVGRIHQRNEAETHIHFEDGDRGWVRNEQLIPYMIPIGMRVMGRWRMGGQYYPGVVTDARGDQVHIQYDDGDHEWTSPAALAIPAERNGPDARATKTAWRVDWRSFAWMGFVLLFFAVRACR